MKECLEILAPAGDEACLDAALRAGADAIYFGLDSGFNARARAKNFPVAGLVAVMDKIHDHGRRGYLALNTLVFDDELGQIERITRLAADAGVDAIIVQDFAVARLVKRLAPTLRLHASTQIACTDLPAIQLLARLGIERITLARELTLQQIAGLVAASPVELEIFAHGALCIAYSGQCLASLAIGGRSANRGACAQACRHPYDLLVDGVLLDLGDVAYPLSPKDLDASQRVPELLASGVRAIKIEGRMKGPDYVAATTLLYRRAVDAALVGESAALGPLHELSTQAFSRGASTGYLQGIDHQALVDGTTCDHIGVEVGTCLGVATLAGRRFLRVRGEHPLALGDGILVQGGRAGHGEFGGRIWQLRAQGAEVTSIGQASEALAWLGPDASLSDDCVGRRVFRTSASALPAEIAAILPREPERVPIAATLSGTVGHAPRLSFETADGRRADVEFDVPLELARTRPIDVESIREKLGRLGDTPYRLERLDVAIPDGSTLALSALNRARREATRKLADAAHRPQPVRSDFVLEQVMVLPDKALPPPGLFVTCRTREQAEAALSSGAQGIYLDLLGMTGVGPLLRELRRHSAATLGIALPRIREPGEESFDAYVRSLEPQMVLVRSLGSLASIEHQRRTDAALTATDEPTFVGDFSLNVTNRVTALDLLARPLSAFTPGYDLDAGQLSRMLDTALAGYAEVVIHHPMPLFHMQHCVFAARLSNGHDSRDCGRPCERHVVSLRDRRGVDLPLEADVACRNTVFHGVAQNGADLVQRLRAQGVRRFRVELLRETGEQAEAVVRAHAELIEGHLTAPELRQRLSTAGLRLVNGFARL
jgi:U32 family peptidase